MLQVDERTAQLPELDKQLQAAKQELAAFEKGGTGQAGAVDRTTE